MPPAPRDLALLDTLDAMPRELFTGHVWRTVRDDRDPTEPTKVAGRWSLGLTDVLYTSLERDGSIAEVYYRLSRQPVFPSKYRAETYRLAIRAKEILKFPSLRELEKLGVDAVLFQEPSYNRTQEIGDAAAFLGFHGLIAPNARWDCLNLMLFSGGLEDTIQEVASQGITDLQAWDLAHPARARRGR